MDLNNLLFFFILALSSYFFCKYAYVILEKINPKILIDNQFNKPQAFHETPVYILGGMVIFLSFLIIQLYLFLSKQLYYYEYLSFCSLFFLLGLVDDLKINIRPKFRLITMGLFLMLLVFFNNFYIENTGIAFINNLLKIDIFSFFFICLCFLFIVNGSNLIDGFNGLLSIHSIIILVTLFFINYLSQNYELAYILFFVILVVIIFLKYNFPYAKIFLGDSGSYFLGTFIAVSVIKTSIANPLISPFFFCILLFYLFFEVFFSFFRKVIVGKKSPLYPDNKHLHMLIYKILYMKNKNKLKSNYQVSIIINLIYLILIIPAIFMMGNGLFCKYYSLLFFILYIYSYQKIKNSLEKNV